MNYIYENYNQTNFLDESDSDSSDLKNRSPLTQTLSLSDASSSSSKKITLSSDLNISSEDEFDREMGKFEKGDNEEQICPPYLPDLPC